MMVCYNYRSVYKYLHIISSYHTLTPIMLNIRNGVLFLTKSNFYVMLFFRMEWFKSGVGEAIKVCHQKQCLLIVYVYGELVRLKKKLKRY